MSLLTMGFAFDIPSAQQYMNGNSNFYTFVILMHNFVSSLDHVQQTNKNQEKSNFFLNLS